MVLGLRSQKSLWSLAAPIHFSPLTGKWFTGFLFIHGFFFRSKKARFVHSQIHLAITGECFTYSLHSRKYIHAIHANSGQKSLWSHTIATEIITE